MNEGSGPAFDRVAVIYNPRSTSRRSEKIARRLVRRLQRAGLSNIRLEYTKRPGHAWELAKKAAARYAHPLIISVSGDGGYNEVINGVMEAVAEGEAGDPVCAVEAAGNANDHYNVIRTKPLIQAIKQQNVLQIDLLLLEAKAKNFTLKRYAHSYIGFGVTPHVARELNLQKLNRWRELQILVRTMAQFRSFQVQFDDGTSGDYDSIVFSNIRRMAKVLRITRQTEPDDGSFEMVRHPHSSKYLLLWSAIKIAVRGPRASQKIKRFSFTLPQPQAVQFDGEVVQLPAHCRVTVSCRHHALKTL